MSYIALARKWRPRTFSQLVGQDQINKALMNSLSQQRLHHAYLFTGTRGVGKTSIARLLAKSLNCETGITPIPCLECEACNSIEQNRFIDLIEIDGASKTRVEDTREILENVQYAPTCGRFKIYIIDEVHMLSQHSFNALLKTLEEPPQHVKFLLATTDPQKLPITVLSRCLQFNLKPLSPEVIAQQLCHILEDEHLNFEQQALDLLAKAARGSMRDALSLMDQAIAMGENTLYAYTIKDILGYTQQDYALLLLQTLSEYNIEKLISLSRNIAADGGSFEYILEEMLAYLHQILLSQNLPKFSTFITPQKDIVQLGNEFNSEDAQLFYQIALKGMEEIQLAPTPAIGFEMTLLRMCTFQPASSRARPKLAFQEETIEIDSESTEITEPVYATESTYSVELPYTTTNVTESPSLADSVDAAHSKESTPAKEDNNNNKSHALVINNSPPVSTTDDWSVILPALKLSGLTLSAAENTEFINKTGAKFNLRVARGHQSLFTSSVIHRIEQALSHYYSEPMKLALQNNEHVTSTLAQQKQRTKDKKHEEAELALQNDPFFQQLQTEFSAEVIKNSITPQEDSL